MCLSVYRRAVPNNCGFVYTVFWNTVSSALFNFFVQFYMAEVCKLHCLTKQDKIWLLSLCSQRISSTISIDGERGSNLRDSRCQRRGSSSPASLLDHSLHLLPCTGSGPGLSLTELIHLTKLGEKVDP